ncbi:MAG: tRNA pseudouridine(13) synthase TruD [archaeon]
MKIKENPEDFIVKEKLKLEIGNGLYAYYILKKKQWNTLNAVREIAKRLNINEKKISYAGLKDKQAITEQYISILDGRKDYENVQINDIELIYVGNGPERVHLGQLEGNQFEIVVKDAGEAKTRKVMPNYFDEQRFGRENTNATVGKALVQKDFKKTCEILRLDIEENNYIGALQKQGRIIKLYFHSYQSKLFNLILSEYIKKKHKYKEIDCGYAQLAFPEEDIKEEIKIPLIHFDMEAEEELKEIINEVLIKEGILLKDFVIKQLPELVSQTEYRDGFVEIKNLQIEGAKLKFELQKGSYATVAIKTLFLHNL